MHFQKKKVTRGTFKILSIILTLSIFAQAFLFRGFESKAISNSDKTELVNMFTKMLTTADYSMHDVSKYNLYFHELKELYDKAGSSGDALLAKYCYSYLGLGDEKLPNSKVKTVYLKTYGRAPVDFKSNFSKIKQNTNRILSGIQNDMTEADKALYLHDELVKCTVYANSNNYCYMGGGPLIFGTGICSGYNNAYTLLLKLAGIESFEVYNSNHSWNYVKIDNKWYNVDATWDDTGYSKGTGNGIYFRHFFLRSDKEFQTDKLKKHTGYKVTPLDGSTAVADSTIYSDSVLHDVENQIAFYKGYWYFANGKNIEKAKLTSSTSEVVYTAASNVEIVDIKDGVLTYRCNSESSTINLNGSESNVPKPEPKPEPEPSIVTKKTVASYYLLKKGGSRTNYKASNYISLGKGYITKEETIKNDSDKILKNLTQIPDYSKYLNQNEYVEWYSIKKEGDGWHVDGEIKENKQDDNQKPSDPKPSNPEPKPSDPEPETPTPVNPEPQKPSSTATKAMFYLVKQGGSRTNYKASNYISLGSGTILTPTTIKNDEEAILKNLGEIPSYSKYIPDGYRVQWYSIKKENDGWHVDGEIIQK
jgi:hypothetical protein